jgi:regulator of protease activity HflC (stomatin/prohibitin superfamily)
MPKNADHLSYQRASTISAFGLAIQLALAVAMLVYGVLGGDFAATYGSIPMFFGVPIWIALLLVFHQHKLERLEAIETEAFRQSDASQASVFDEVGADQVVQASRLSWMHRLLLPVLSVVIGVVAVILALLLLFRTGEVELAAELNSGWGIAIGVATAFLGFVFARFVAGMARQPIWSLLNGGAGIAMAGALIGLLLAIGHFLDMALDERGLLETLPTVFRVFLLVYGIEVLANTILNFYKPRRAGEYLRPGFDSRILALAAAPDRITESISGAINYQFGFSVTDGWFFKLLKRFAVPAVVVGVLLVWGMTCFVVIKPDETGLKITHGQIQTYERTLADGTVVETADLEPGLVVKLPWPFSRVVTFSSTAVNEIVIGTRKTHSDGQPLLWKAANQPGEQFMLVQPSRAITTNSRFRDLSILSLEMSVQYVVDDLRSYYELAQDGPGRDREAIRRNVLTTMASAAATQYVSTFAEDQVLGAERAEIAAGLKDLIQNVFNRHETGVRVMFAGIAGVHPSSDVAAPFEDVVAADQDRLREIELAEAERISTLARAVGDIELADRVIRELDELDRMSREDAGAEAIAEQEALIMAMIQEAGGEAATTLSQARSNRWSRHMGERARAIRREGELAAYRAAPAAFLADRLLAAWATATENARVFVVPESLDVRIDQTEINQSLDFRSSDDSEGASQ